MYNILEARTEFKDGKITRVTVLVEISKNDVRAIFASTTPRGGYTFIKPTDQLTEDLLQRVAAEGMETVDRDDIFPTWRKKYLNQ